MGIGVYRGQASPEMQGIYFAGDYGSCRIWGLVRDGDDNWIFAELLHTGLHLTGAGEDEAGNLSVTSCECVYGGPGPFENPPGTLWQLVAADQVPEDAEVAPTATPEAEGEGEAECLHHKRYRTERLGQGPVASSVLSSPLSSRAR